MMDKTFKALVVKERGDGTFHRTIEKRDMNDLPGNDVLVRVHYSSLNYKDALSASGNRGVTKQYPHIPGIDAAGIVEQSRDSRFEKGDRVLVTGYDLGQNTFGGFSAYISVPAGWIVPLPPHLSLRESMVLGTAGFTAAIGVHHLQSEEVGPENGPVLVTGATGGVGTLAVAILSKAGYEVVAATGKSDQHPFLKELGASSVIHRDEVQDESSKLLLPERWGGVIDTVGGLMLDTAIRQTRHTGCVACCGNILGGELHTNVYPFILRGVSLKGIDSGNCLMELRKKLWQKLSEEWKPVQPEKLSKEVTLDGLNKEIDRILQGRQVGRVLVNLDQAVL